MPGESPKLKSAEAVMPVETAALFTEIRDNPLLYPFILIGGTALSLHIGHRVSEDLDLITLLPRLPRMALRQLEQELEKNGHQIIHQINPAAYEDFQNSGLELMDCSQDWIVDNSVKLTFFAAENHHAKLLSQRSSGKSGESGFRIASFQELCQLKAIVATSRSKTRDWLDLFIVEKDFQFGIPQWKEAFDQAGLTPMHFEIALNRICSGKVSDEDEGYSALLANPPTIEEMQNKFRILREEYEIALAKEKLGDTPPGGIIGS